jgi:hypothetical protein
VRKIQYIEVSPVICQVVFVVFKREYATLSKHNVPIKTARQIIAA